MTRNLLWRVLAGMVFLPVLFFLIHLGGWAFQAFIFLVVTLGAWEWWRLGRPHTSSGEFPLVLAGCLGVVAGAADPRPERLAIFLAFFLLIALLALLRHADGQAHRRAGHLTLGILYVGLLPAFLLRIHSGEMTHMPD